MPTSTLPIEPVIQDTEVIASTISPVLFGGLVLFVILSNHAVFSEFVQWVHLRFTMPIRDKKGPWMARPFLYLTMVLILTSHLVDIVIWAYALVWSGKRHLAGAVFQRQHLHHPWLRGGHHAAGLECHHRRDRPLGDVLHRLDDLGAHEHHHRFPPAPSQGPKGKA
jgi:hypothetical protein